MKMQFSLGRRWWLWMLLVFFTTILILSVCTPSGSGNLNQSPDDDGDQLLPQLTLDAYSVKATSDGTNGSIYYTVDNPKDGVSLLATCVDDWVNVNVFDDYIGYEILANRDKKSRYTTLEISYGEISQIIDIVQDGGNSSSGDTGTVFELLSSENVKVDYLTGTVKIVYNVINPTPNTHLKVSCNAQWLSERNRPGNTIIFDVDSNPNSSERNAQITVEYGKAKFTVKVCQAGKPEVRPISTGNNVIYYTTTDGKVLGDVGSMNVTMVSNTYSNGRGVMKFNGDITKIGSYAFQHSDKLLTITLPATLSEIGEYAFYGCDNLESIYIPYSVVKIGDAAFSACQNLHEFKGRYAVDNGSSLIINGKFISFAPASAYYHNNGIREYTIPDGVVMIGDYAFDCCSYLTSVTIPTSVSMIGDYAFRCCSSLSKVTIPNTITIISTGLFKDCSNLNSVTIPNSVTTIKDEAFYNCSLYSITLPNSVTEIGYRAFYRCDSGMRVYCKSETPPTIGSYVFPSDCYIKVPRGSVNKYKNKNGWKNYRDRISKEY